MSEMMSVSAWLKENGFKYPTEVAVLDRTIEQRLFKIFGYTLTQNDWPPHSYKRYGYLLSHYVAQLFAFNIGARAMNFSGRLFNCGMATISTVLEALALKPGDRIVCSAVLYSETLKELKSLARWGVEVVEVDQQNFDQLTAAIESGNTKLVFVETVGNGPTMPVVDFPRLLEYAKGKQLTVVLDNTLLTTELYNPFTHQTSAYWLGQGAFRFIYTESGTKFYRVSKADETTAGIVVAPDDFIPTLDAVISRRGTYLPFPDLLLLPIDLAEACVKVGQHNNNAVNLFAKLKENDQWFEPVYPDVSYAQGSGAIIYANVKGNVEQVQQFLQAAQIPQVGSFGHDFTSVIHFGKYPELGCVPGQIRFAVGRTEDIRDTIKRLSQAAVAILG